jgi:PatG C-terminal
VQRLRAARSGAQSLDGFLRQAMNVDGNWPYPKGEDVMEQTELNEQSTNQLAAANEAEALAPPADSNSGRSQAAQVNPATCATCGATAASNGNGATAPSYVFAIGRVEMRFPTLGVEKEFAQARGRANTKGLTDRAADHAVLSEPANRYLARQVCWVLTIEGLETYILIPRDPADYNQLLEAVRPLPSPLDIDVVVGVRGPIAPPEMCNGLMVPIVIFDQIYSFDRTALIEALPAPKGAKAKDYGEAATELFDRIMLLADNAGSTDEHRALNYLAVRYPAVYHTVADAFGRDSSLSAVDVQSSPLSGTRNVVDVIFSFTNRATDVVEKFSTRVDVTEEFPFLVTKMSPYFDR